HLVAAAVPGMSVERVTVLSTDGTLLASGDDGANATSGRMAALNTTVNREIEGNVRRTLAPYLGLDNFEVSVTAQINTDKRVVSETVFDPESRVERSIRIIRENETAQNLSRETPTTVQQNIPQEEVAAAPGEQSSEETQRREELTNYEISSRQVQTSSDGFVIENLSVALLVNRARLASAIGEDASAQALAAEIAEIEQLVASAAGIQGARGDTVKVSVVNFLDDNGNFEPIPGPGAYEILLRQSGNIVSALTMLLVAAMLIWFGLRPAVNAIVQRQQEEPAESALQIAADDQLPSFDPVAQLTAHADVNLIEDISRKLNNSTIKRLEQIVQLNEEQAAHILKQWMHAGEQS
ncbi:MAG TPA: flagellar M-ring protein FliF C-terminal domain-containing protein, partial [Saliniramus sp.]|nr:flagellar M-ring protein FliF C-terminal domain-containing protein [Saliniramus sp.]